MLKHKLLEQRQAFRFTRWSRNAAASFHSIKLVVNIGQLSANVLERIALKCPKTLLALIVGSEVVHGQIEDENDMEAIPPDLLEELMAASNISEPAAVASPI